MASLDPIIRITELEDRVEKIEGVAHEPVQFEECPECFCLVPPRRMEAHQISTHHRRLPSKTSAYPF
jgi:hypothetical protein